MHIGETLGPYVIVDLLGVGGMGEVYKAKDTRLNRAVAIKRTNAEFRDRFEGEARAIAALNHPHICHLYDIGPDYLVMEYIDGSPLATVASPKQLLDLAVQIADALASAHAVGIVHRDLKPANILVTTPTSEHPNQVKVLDFGVALDGRARSGATPLAELQTRPATAAGSLVGTAAYMSPEQARGEPVTPQSDQFSFGLVLYEMATGRNPFIKDSTPETLTAIIRESAPPLPLTLPAPFRWIIERLLLKEPGDRYDSTRDLYRELRQLRDRLSDVSLVQTALAAPAATSQRRLGWLALTIALALVAAVATWTVTRTRSAPSLPLQPIMRVSLELPGAMSPPQVNFAISPDGLHVVYLAAENGQRARLMVRTMAESTSVPIEGSELALNPTFSPDGQWIAFTKGGQLLKVPVAGGRPALIAEAAVLTGMSWGDSGLIVAAFATSTQQPTQTSLGVVSDAGGPPQALTSLGSDQVTHRWPQLLPGGDAVLYTAHNLLDAFDDADIRAVSVKTRQSKTILSRGYFARYVPSGHLVFMRDGLLHGVRFDRERLEVIGSPVPLLNDVAASPAWGSAQFTFSNTGVFAYRQPASSTWSFVWMDPKGEMQPLLATAGTHYGPRLSPDGRALAYSGTLSTGDVHVYEWARDKVTRVTADGRSHFSPVWAPDGNHIVYRTYLPTTDEFALDWARADGGGEPHRLLTSRGPLMPGDISRNGDLVYTQGEVGYDIWTVKLDLTNTDRPSVGTPVPVVRTSANELQPVLSPDGRWLAYVANPPGQGRAVFVRPFPPTPGAPDRRWQVSAGAGDLPVWSRNGRLFYGFYGSADPTSRQIYEVPYNVSGDTFVVERSQPASTRAHLDLELYRSFDVSPDGERFVVAPALGDATRERATTRPALLLNFFDELTRRIP